MMALPQSIFCLSLCDPNVLVFRLLYLLWFLGLYSFTLVHLYGSPCWSNIFLASCNKCTFQMLLSSLWYPVLKSITLHHKTEQRTSSAAQYTSPKLFLSFCCIISESCDAKSILTFIAQLLCIPPNSKLIIILTFSFWIFNCISWTACF